MERDLGVENIVERPTKRASSDPRLARRKTPCHVRVSRFVSSFKFKKYGIRQEEDLCHHEAENALWVGHFVRRRKGINNMRALSLQNSLV